MVPQPGFPYAPASATLPQGIPMNPKKILSTVALMLTMLALEIPTLGPSKAGAEPPFYGTIFIVPDIITASDPTGPPVVMATSVPAATPV
jgi:hypothetical protein